MLSNAVRTSWYRDIDNRPSLAEALVEHATDVLRTSFRRERGLEGKLGGLPPAPDLTTAAVQHDAVLSIDGVDRPAARIDTDPHVFAIGALVDDSTFLTAVLTRDELSHVRLEFSTRPTTPLTSS